MKSKYSKKVHNPFIIYFFSLSVYMRSFQVECLTSGLFFSTVLLGFSALKHCGSLIFVHFCSFRYKPSRNGFGSGGISFDISASFYSYQVKE